MTRPIVRSRNAVRYRLGSVALLMSLAAGPAAAIQIDIAGPPGSVHFGQRVYVLPNSNFVVTDPDGVASGAGGVFLYGPSGNLISTTTGSQANDHIGSSGIVVLPNSNFLILSPQWHNAAVANAGAVTFVNGTTGLNAAVSPVNSLVGSTLDDQVGNGSNTVKVLANGAYVVTSSFWDGSAVNSGAVTFGSGTTGVSGTISASNSLIGGATSDFNPSSVIALTNGNYVISAPSWDNGATANVGAVVWGSGSVGVKGSISVANALTGTTASDGVGTRTIALSNGNYAIGSGPWDNGVIANVGAITWGNGMTGTFGTIGTGNSLVGSTAGDQVGGFLTALVGNGNFVASTVFWDNGAAVDAGAVTFVNGSGPVTGTVSPANSLVGSTSSDRVGSVTPLANGNYVVASAQWDNGATVNAGAATFGNGASGVSGAISAANSLVGTSANDGVPTIVSALSDGDYVLRSVGWSNGSAIGAGAVTWVNGSTGASGIVSAANSLVGSHGGDAVGSSGVVELTNGNFVVLSSNWDNGVVDAAGAATWCSGSGPTAGPVTPSNSLVGSTAVDAVGTIAIALSNGNYVIASTQWDNGSTADAGAVTWGNGTTGTAGAVGPANSLVGSTTFDNVGERLIALRNGDYAVGASGWDNAGTFDVGGVAVLHGTAPFAAAFSATNALVGILPNDAVAADLFTYSDGALVAVSSGYDDGVLANVGAISLIDSASAPIGPLTPASSVIGTVAGAGNTLNSPNAFDYDPQRHQLVVGRRDSNLVSLFFLNATLFKDGFE